MSTMEAGFDICTAYGLKAGTHPEETSQAPEANNTGGATVSTLNTKFHEMSKIFKDKTHIQ